MPSQVGYEPAGTGAPSAGGKSTLVVVVSTVSNCRQTPVWRAGANSATKLLGGLTVPAGDHTLYVDLTTPDQWTLIVNKKTGQWGLSYDKSADVGRVKMKMSKPAAMAENLKYTLTDSSLTLEWENLSGTVSLKVK